MNYRPFGKTGLNFSILGFGCMRFPTLHQDNSKIDKKATSKLIYYAIDNGINYFDTAYVYHQGQSEVFLGQTLKHKRSKIYLATKMPVWLITQESDFDKYFIEQLKRLQTDHIDLYLLHNLNPQTWNQVTRLNVLNWLQKTQKKGLIKYIGFSTHQNFAEFKKIIDTFNWDFTQIQYNYMDTETQVTKAGFDYAALKNIPIIIMEPLKGGQLAKSPPSVQKIWNSTKEHHTPAQWAFSWLYNHSQINCVLSGMTSLSQLQENIQTAQTLSHPHHLSPSQIKLFDRVIHAYRRLLPIPCTECLYCQPCPQGVNIPHIFRIYNEAKIYQALTIQQSNYNRLPESNRPSHCTSCGHCLRHCPQAINIPSQLKIIDQFFQNK